MQPDSIRPAARIPNFALSDDIYSSNRKSRARTPTLRPKRHDSIQGSIGEIVHNSQRLDACSALQRAGCVFLAATFPFSG
jgi:hypothetical protein